MKKGILILVLAGIIVLPSFSRIRPGVKGTLGDFSWCGNDWDEAELSGSRNKLSPSFGGGIFLEIPIAGMLSLQPEALFVHASIRQNMESGWVEETWNLFEFPVYLKVSLNLWSGFLYGMIGPTYYILGDIRIKSSGGAPSSSYDNNFLAGISAVAGYEFSGRSSVGLKYFRHLKRYLDNSDLFVEGFAIEMGYKF